MSRLVRVVAVAIVAVATLALSACGGTGEAAPAATEPPRAGADEAGLDPPDADGPDSTGAPAPDAGTDAPPTTEAVSPLADRIVELDPATGLDGLEIAPSGPVPVALDIPDLGVSAAPVLPVGVEPDGEMEIPAATEVGWYRFGAVPGEAGGAVLAAHIAFDGVDGVFRHLDRLSAGQRVTVAFDDGSTSTWEVVQLAQYDKDELPGDLFSDGGEPRLALITCGGDFNPQLRSYEDNVVAYAVPV